MSIADAFIGELEHEGATTRRFLERVPEDRLSWSPHERSMTLGQLALHLASIPKNVTAMAALDEAPPPNFEKGFDEATSVAQILETHDAGLPEAIATIRSFSDDRMRQPWRLVVDGTPTIEMPRLMVIRMIVLNHSIHHRGQLGVFLRLVGATVPSAYGPSADEMPPGFE